MKMELKEKLVQAILTVLDEYVKSIIAITATFAWFGMLGFSLYYAYLPPYADLFNKILNCGIVTGFIWRSYFVSNVLPAMRRNT